MSRKNPVETERIFNMFWYFISLISAGHFCNKSTMITCMNEKEIKGTFLVRKSKKFVLNRKDVNMVCIETLEKMDDGPIKKMRSGKALIIFSPRLFIELVGHERKIDIDFS